MKETRYFYVPDAANQNELPADEATHALRVLRLKAGDEMMLIDGEGCYYRAEVTVAASHHCYYAIRETLPQPPQWPGRVQLAIAPTKLADRIEWMTEKAVEVGVDEISFLNCQFSERRQIKLQRLEKIAVAAVKQSRKPSMPRLVEMTPLARFIATPREGRKYIAHCYEEVPRCDLFADLCQAGPGEPLTVLIGPEGDFSIEEVRQAVDAGFRSVSLGESRLRTETAGLAAVMMMQLSKKHNN